MRSIITSLVAASLLVASTASAAALPAAPADSRVASPVQTAEGTSGDSSDTWIWIGAGVVAIILLFLLLDDDDEEPESP